MKETQKRQNTVLRGVVTKIERKVVGLDREESIGAGGVRIPMLITLNDLAKIEFIEEVNIDIGDELIVLAEKVELTHRLNSYAFNAYYNITKKVSYVRHISRITIGGLPSFVYCFGYIIFTLALSAVRLYLVTYMLLAFLPLAVYRIYSDHKENKENEVFMRETEFQLQDEMSKSSMERILTLSN